MITDFLQLVLEILQLPIIILIVIFCHRTGVVLKFPQMNFIVIAFIFNFFYIVLQIIDSMITRFFAGFDFGSLYKLTEFIDLVTFSFFPITCYYFLKQDTLMRSEDYRFKKIINYLLRPYLLSFLIISLMTICFVSFFYDHTGRLYMISSAIFKATSILSLLLFFFTLKSHYVSTRFYVLIGLAIWLLLQFTSLLDENFVNDYSYIFFSLSTVTKILIAVSIFKNPLILEKIQLQKEKAAEFENILAVALHELNTPLDSLELNLSTLVKSDKTKGKSFLQLESDYEILRVIVEYTEESFREVTEGNKFSNFNKRKKAKSIVNLNKTVIKCVLLLKNNYKAEKLDIKISFGKEVHALVNENEIFQIVLNIIRNAIEAYEADDEKAIHITTEYDKFKDAYGNKVAVIKVEDFAGGISKENEELIWQQGYSTKERPNKVIKGQGLYLSKDLAERNNIELKFISSQIEERKKAKGTIFLIKFLNSHNE